MKSHIKNSKLGIQHSGFREFLLNEFLRRTRKNSGYSMRAFAQSLNIDQSFLSKLLRGQRNFTPNRVKKMSFSLGLGPEKVQEFFNAQVSFKYDPLSNDQFYVISNWYHFAIFRVNKASELSK